MRVRLIVLALAFVSCATSTAPVAHTEYQYTLASHADEIDAGGTLVLTWQATPRTIAGAPPARSVARVCVALIGPYADVAAAKASPGGPFTCPIDVPGTMAATGATEVDLLVGAPAEQDLPVPSALAPGFYNIWNVTAYGRAGNGNVASAAGIIEVRAGR